MLFSPSSVGEVSGNIFTICYLYNVYKITVRSGRKKRGKLGSNYLHVYEIKVENKTVRAMAVCKVKNYIPFKRDTALRVEN